MSRFAVGERDFLLDGSPYRIISGALHYPRVHPDLWADRIHKARLMGLTTIETYVPWSFHAPSRGEFVTTDGLDLGRFLDLIAAEGMTAVVRPGPYVCAEWNRGALPAWLLQTRGMRLRSSDPLFLEPALEHLRRVYELVAPRQIDAAGSVVLVQIENEYGAFGSDQDYLASLVEVARESGITVPLTTVDQMEPEMIANGSTPAALRTASFGSRAAEKLAVLREHQPTGPLMVTELWNGWFDHWGVVHRTVPAADAAAELDAVLAAGASANIYMFHGGTNFGTSNGATDDYGVYRPITTSYDYDAPLDEAGAPTAKYFAYRDVISRYRSVPDDVPDAPGPAPEFVVDVEASVPLADVPDAVSDTMSVDHLPAFDELPGDPVLVRYRTTLSGGGSGLLELGAVRDRAWVTLDGTHVGVLARDLRDRVIRLPAARGELELLIEDQGGINYASHLGEPKGPIGGARLDGSELTGWTVDVVDLARIPVAAGALPAGIADGPGPRLSRARFELERASDLFLDTSRWGKGFAWINGFALGRYWRRGPQQALYVPAPSTRVGANELVVLELETPVDPRARFVDGLRLTTPLP